MSEPDQGESEINQAMVFGSTSDLPSMTFLQSVG
jgi:hypothetical protein